MWTSLPNDLLVEILRRLDAASAVIGCAGACKPWRRGIIANASNLRLSPDRFNPNLLLGFFHRHWLNGRHVARLQYVPGPFENLLPANIIAAETTAEPYAEPLSSRDGLVLLGLGSSGAAGDLGLCNLVTGSISSVPGPDVAAPISSKPCRYVIVTGDHGNDGLQILAVRQGGGFYYFESGEVAYQVFSSVSGEWGPIRFSAITKYDRRRVSPQLCDGVKDVVVCRDSVVYWLVESIAVYGHDGRRGHRSLLAVDACTERTWTVELPERFMAPDICISYSMIAMATTVDGNLSLMLQLPGPQIEVWVLIDGGRWMLRRVIDVQGLLPSYYCLQVGHVRLSGFCPRSGCLFGDIDGKDLLIDVHWGSVWLTGRFGVGRVTKYPYEMDWPTYISKMKYF